MIEVLICLILLPFAIMAFIALWPLWLVLALVFFVLVNNADSAPMPLEGPIYSQGRAL
jgi:hypothetical protein